MAFGKLASMTDPKVGGCPCVCHKLPPNTVVHVVSCCDQYRNQMASVPAETSQQRHADDSVDKKPADTAGGTE